LYEIPQGTRTDVRWRVEQQKEKLLKGRETDVNFSSEIKKKIKQVLIKLSLRWRINNFKGNLNKNFRIEPQ
jgi:hypothetical protein